MFRETQDPKESELSKFQSVIKQHESLVTAREYKGEVDARVGRVTEEPPKEPRKTHYLCNTTHEPGKCPQVCKGCGKKGSHLEDKCWTKHPELKPKFPTPRKKKEEKKGRKERRSRSKSVEKKEKRTRN